MKCGASNLTRREFLLGLAALTASAALPRFVLAASERDAWHERMWPLMGTFVAVAIKSSSREQAFGILESSYQFLEARIAELSNWDESSLVSKLKHEKVLSVVPESLTRLCAVGARAEKITEGKFCLNSLPLTEVWRAAKAVSSLPDKIDLKFAKREIETSAIEFGSQGIVLHGNAGFDVGGIGKGLIADMLVEHLAAQGVTQARVACSGDLRFLGAGPWEIEIEDPRKEAALRTINLRGDIGIATSGDYRNYWFVNGRRYHHLIDPQTGLPGEHNQQVTVIAPNAALADALASGLFFLPASDALSVIRGIPGIEGIIVDAGHQIHFSS